MSAEILVSGDPSHCRWIGIALGYLPEDILDAEGENLAIIGLGGMGGCRLPQQYRAREIILLSDWIFPPAGHSEGEDTGKFFIVTLLHEIAHAVCRHKSPNLDNLSPCEAEAQENEADKIAIEWYNNHVDSLQNEHLVHIEVSTFRGYIERYSKLSDVIEDFKGTWHQDNGA